MCKKKKTKNFRETSSWELIGKDQDKRYVMRHKRSKQVYSTIDLQETINLIGEF